MDEDLMVQDSSVEGGEVANSNVEGMDNPGLEVDPGTEDNAGEIDGQAEQLETNSEDNPPGVETSKAFADRLSKKTKALEKEFQEKYGRYASVIEKEAAKYGITAEEYLAEIEARNAEEEAERQREADIQKYGDLPPEQLEKVKKADEIVAKQAEQERYINEARALRKEFPNVKSADDIPDEVFAIRELEGCSLLTAYKSYAYEQAKANKEQIKIEGEQAAIKGLIKNQNTPGSLSKSTPDNSPRDIRSIPDTEFEQMIEMVKMGQASKIKL